MTLAGDITPWTLLALTFAIGLGQGPLHAQSLSAVGVPCPEGIDFLQQAHGQLCGVLEPHPAVGKPDLNDAGRYYKEHHTLEGYKEKK